MPDDPNQPGEPQRDVHGNPVPPPYGAYQARPLPGNPPPPPSGGPAPGGTPGAQQYDQRPGQEYDLSGSAAPSAGEPPPQAPYYQAPYYGVAPGGPPPAWPPQPGPYGQPPGPYGQPLYYPVQVNGSQILIMGIVAFFCFGFILGPMAYVQGNSALAAIDRGEADPVQRSNVAAGRICGLIASILAAVGVVTYVGLMLIGVLAGSHN